MGLDLKFGCVVNIVSNLTDATLSGHKQLQSRIMRNDGTQLLHSNLID